MRVWEDVQKNKNNELIAFDDDDDQIHLNEDFWLAGIKTLIGHNINGKKND